MTTSTIIFRISKFGSDPTEFVPSHFVTLFVKSNSFDKDIELLIRSLTEKSSWQTLVENSTVYFPELADKSNQIKLSFIDKGGEKIMLKNDVDLACVLQMNKDCCVSSLPIPLYIVQFRNGLQ